MRKRSLVALASLFVSGSLHAQERSDLMPEAPQPPAGRQGIVYPGAPLPPAPNANAGNDVAATPAVKGRAGYNIYDNASTFGSIAGRSRIQSDRMPETHTVQRGDTLWDIAGYYFRNPWYWPKLWSFNPSITNPHWIYPGDIVRLVPAGDTPVAVPTSREPERIHAPIVSSGVFLRDTGFIEPDELKLAGTIVGSKEERIMLGDHDEAYVEINKDAPLKAGERYTVYRPLEDVKHPVTKKKIGTLVQILGEAEVKTYTDGRIARVNIIDATDPIERGYRVGPLRRQFKVVEPVRNDRDLDGVVITTIQPIKLLGATNIVFIDRGKNDGVRVGNRFQITRRGDGVQPLLGTKPIDDPRYPREVFGQILVIDVRDGLSTGLLTRSIQDIRIGDRVEARKNF